MLMGLSLLSCQAPNVNVIPTETAEAVTVRQRVNNSTLTPTIIFPTPLPTTNPATVAPINPTASPTEQASFTPTPLATVAAIQPSATPAPSQTPTPITNPLTGIVSPDPDQLNQRPIAVKVSNWPSVVRPQAGLSRADIIFEHYMQGSVTRLTAIFYSQDAEAIGSVRSSRLIDLQIAPMFDAAMAFASGNDALNELYAASDFIDVVISPGFQDGGFYRSGNSDVDFEHTLFTSTDRLRTILQNRGQDVAPQIEQPVLFSAEIPPASQSTSSIFLTYPGTSVYWAFDPSDRTYKRWTDNEPHRDSNNGNQLAFRNIVIVFADHEGYSIERDSFGNSSTAINLLGEGRVIVFRDGNRYDGRWVRPELRDSFQFIDTDSNPIPLAPGTTFYQIVPLDFDSLITPP